MKIPKRGMVQRGVNYNSSSKWSTKSQLLLLYTMWHKSRCSTLWLKAIVTHKSLQQKGFYHSTPIFKISCLYYKYDLYIRLLYTPMLLFSVSHHSHLARSRYKWSRCTNIRSWLDVFIFQCKTPSLTGHITSFSWFRWGWWCVPTSCCGWWRRGTARGSSLRFTDCRPAPWATAPNDASGSTRPSK